MAEIARRKGLLPERDLPFDSSITTWDEYYSGITEAMMRSGKTFEKNWNISHRWVWQGEVGVGRQRKLLTAALQRSPVGVAVFGWAKDERGIYVRPEGAAVQHWCVLIGSDEKGRWLVLDSYEPYIKTLDENYQFEMPKVYAIERKVSTNWLEILLTWLAARVAMLK